MKINSNLRKRGEDIKERKIENIKRNNGGEKWGGTKRKNRKEKRERNKGEERLRR
jgi:hypothetical protein